MRFNILIIILITLQSCVVNCLDLEPVSISEIRKNEFTFDLHFDEKNITTLIIKKVENCELKDIGASFFQTIGKEIELILDMQESYIHHMKWEITINTKLGILKVFSISAEVNSTHIHLISKHIQLEQKIETQYETKRQCSNSGHRKYKLAGPRKEECHDHRVIRDLNEEEIKQVNLHLMSKLSEAMLLIKK